MRVFLVFVALIAFLAIPAALIADFPAPIVPARPEGLGDIEVRPGAFLAMFGFGFLLAAAGHLYKSNFVVGVGIAIVFVTMVLIPIALYAGGAG